MLLLFHAGAAIFFYNNAQHPHVEANTAIRKDGLAEERDSMAQEGHETKESMGRKFSRCVVCRATCLASRLHRAGNGQGGLGYASFWRRSFRSLLPAAIKMWQRQSAVLTLHTEKACLDASVFGNISIFVTGLTWVHNYQWAILEGEA